MPHIFCLAQFANRTHGPPIVVARQARGEAFLLTGIQGSPTLSAHFGPIAGRNGSWGEPPVQPDLLAANQPCWPFRRCLTFGTYVGLGTKI